RWRVRIRGALDRHLLPAFVREPEAAARPGHVLPGSRGGRARGLPALPALPPQRRQPRRPARRAGARGVPGDRRAAGRAREARGAGPRLSFAVVPCALGRLLVAATARGICRISLGDDADALERGLAAEFPAATIARDDDTLRHWVAEITAHLDGRQPTLELPLDVRATAFQRRVWEALRKIPYGSTR